SLPARTHWARTRFFRGLDVVSNSKQRPELEACTTMRNPLYLRNTPGETRYVNTYVENSFAAENAFRNKPRRNVEAWPSFEDARRTTLPVPFWPGHEPALACYWR